MTLFKPTQWKFKAQRYLAQTQVIWPTETGQNQLQSNKKLALSALDVQETFYQQTVVPFKHTNTQKIWRASIEWTVCCGSQLLEMAQLFPTLINNMETWDCIVDEGDTNHVTHEQMDLRKGWWTKGWWAIEGQRQLQQPPKAAADHKPAA